MGFEEERRGITAEALGDLAEHHGLINRNDAQYLLNLAGSMSRGRLLNRLWTLTGSDDWWRLVRDNWTECDDLCLASSEMREIFAEANPSDLLLAMTPYERSVWRALPDTFTVYRGCYDHNRDGLSWSLSRKVAERFPALARYHHPSKQALLLTGAVSRHHVFVKTARREREVVVPYVVGAAQLPSV
ncbi:MAG: hypothetical protein L0H23_00645 [Luteimonas sp.]|nr:hypothetical protein [Luteimonas sp.]